MDLKLREMAIRRRFNVPPEEEIPVSVLLYLPLEGSAPLSETDLEWGREVAARWAVGEHDES